MLQQMRRMQDDAAAAEARKREAGHLIMAVRPAPWLCTLCIGLVYCVSCVLYRVCWSCLLCTVYWSCFLYVLVLFLVCFASLPVEMSCCGYLLTP